MRMKYLAVATTVALWLPILGCGQPAGSGNPPVVVNPPPPAGPKVDVGGPRGGVHVDVPENDGNHVRVDIPPRNPPPATTP